MAGTRGMIGDKNGLHASSTIDVQTVDESHIISF